MTICGICNERIREGERTEWEKKGPWIWQNREVHYRCVHSESELVGELSVEEEKAIKFKEKITGSVITDIRLPFERVLAITFQFFIAGLILSIPIWIIFMIALR